MTVPSERLFLAAEDRLGIKADEGDLEKFHRYLVRSYGEEYEDTQILDRVFFSGEAAGFLTVNETYFFREEAHFKLLLELLPSLRGPLSICSAATSAGCEAYSIAMLIEQYNRDNEPVSYHIDAFDINPRVIESAEKGVYGKNSFREDGSSFRHTMNVFLEQSGDEYAVKDTLKQNIHFFVHNILDPLGEAQYDLIFFRNAFIYFSPRNRVRLLSNLTSALRDDGRLIMGVSEIAGVRQPDLVERLRGDVFYFEKMPAGDIPEFTVEPEIKAIREGPPSEGRRKRDLPIDAAGVGAIMADEKRAAELAVKIAHAPADRGDLTGNEQAASALFLLSRGDFRGADGVLKRLESGDDSAFTAFLRGEYLYLQNMFTEAEFQYKVALGKNPAFWPALYRLSALASVEVLRKYRAAGALEILGLGQDLQYEVFMGGFSPDYYLGVLSKQNAG
jgi:chemotaxis methyl-accepting protein methylase